MSRILAALGALALLAGCGIKSDLDRPDPLWNADDVIRAECARQIERNQEPDARCEQYQTGVQTTP